MQRDVVGKRFVSNHQPGRVRARAPCKAFQPHGDVDQFGDLRILIVGFLQFGTFLKRLGQRDAQRIGNHLGEFIDAGQHDTQSATHIANGRLGFHRAERADLGDVLFAVFFLGVIDDLLSSVAAEIDIDIGRLCATGIEKSLEQQVVFQRANITERQQVGDNRAASRPTSLTGNALRLGEDHEVPDDEEVAGVPHLLDGFQLVIEPFVMQIAHVITVASHKSFLAQFAKVFGIGLFIGWCEDGVMRRAEVEIDVDPIGNFLRARDGRHLIGKRGVHFLGCANEEFVARHPHPFFIAAQRARIHAQQHIMRGSIFPVEVMRVVRGDQR